MALGIEIGITWYRRELCVAVVAVVAVQFFFCFFFPFFSFGFQENFKTQNCAATTATSATSATDICFCDSKVSIYSFFIHTLNP
jgi:hypothetical protein